MVEGQHKIALGSAQFGLPYGISNKRGQVPQQEVCQILAACLVKGIDVVDTAAAYGNSEEAIGHCLSLGDSALKVVSKLPSACKANQVEKIIQNTLLKLQIPYLYGYLFHDFNTFRTDPAILDEIKRFQQKGLISKVGFSVYYPQQLEYLLNNNIEFELVQLPFNILDQRFKYLFPALQQAKIEIHVRSVFLQGLMLTKPEKLNNYFAPLLPQIGRLHQLSQSHNISLPHLLLSFVHLHKEINKIVIGVTSLADLEENIGYTAYLPAIKACIGELIALGIDDEQYLLPFNWKLA